tara:strand:- start:7194 stop:8090 length:897 start_codon:yes stop_codon:yes gene_type:complete
VGSFLEHVSEENMKIGLHSAFNSNSVDLANFSSTAEGMGFESIWLPEHVVIPVNPSVGPGGVVDAPIPESYLKMVDPLIGLSIVAAVTEKMMLGTGVCLVPEHHPIDLAKRISTLDLYSKGRFLFGIGAGWQPEETKALGGDFPRRWTQTTESIEVMKKMWTEDQPEYQGNYYSFPPLRFDPKPVSSPHPPIILGSRGPRVFQRTALWGDGWAPFKVSTEAISDGRKNLTLECQKIGRDPSEIEITVFVDPGNEDEIEMQARNYFEAGANRVVFIVDSSPHKDPLEVIQNIAVSTKIQ